MKDEGQRVYETPPLLDETGLIAFLQTQPDVVAAYLFGSLAKGKTKAESDIDMAVLLTRAPDYVADKPDRQFQLMDQIERYADREIDLVILNTAPPILTFQVLSGGRLFYEGDREERVNFEVRAGKIYADLLPTYKFFEQALLREIRETGLGGYG
jgi:uncharacterized protein